MAPTVRLSPFVAFIAQDPLTGVLLPSSEAYAPTLPKIVFPCFAQSKSSVLPPPFLWKHTPAVNKYSPSSGAVYETIVVSDSVISLEEKVSL